MQLSTSEIEAVLKLDTFKRYQYSLKKIADNEVLFTLINKKGEYAFSEIEGSELIPIWSSPYFAAKCIAGHWQEYETKEISLDAFENELAEQIIENEYLLDVFPANDKTGFIVSLDEFMRDLNEELEQYE
ncbi:MAG: hypothetical protein RLZ33_2264 [Bacteroidota bacterium]|jgi:hypothetical protein